MKKFGVFFIATFLFVNVQSGFLDQWAENFERNMQNFGEQLSRNLENQGRVIEQQAHRYAEQVEREQRKRQEEFQKEQDDIMEIVKQIQAGNTPSGVNSANTTSLTENVNGRILTTKTTIYSTGNEKKGTVYTVQAVYEGETVIDWSINSMIWNGSQLIKRLIQYTPQSGNNNFSYNNNGGVIITQNDGNYKRLGRIGGTTITSTNQGGVIVQEISL